MIRVFIVAASPLARAGLHSILASRGLEVVGSAADLDSLTGHLTDTEIDVVLLDSSSESPETLLESLADSGLTSDFALIVLADHPAPNWSAKSLRTGIRGVLPTNSSPDQLVAALQAASAGLVVVHPADLSAVLPTAGNPSVPLTELAEPLTRREREVLQMLAAGLGNKEIAARLSISDHTAKFHVASILGKLGAATRTEAVSLGFRHGLILV